MTRNDNYFFYLNDVLLKMQIVKPLYSTCYALNVWECDANNSAVFSRLVYGHEVDWANKKLDRDLCADLISTELINSIYFAPGQIKIPPESAQETFRLLYE